MQLNISTAVRRSLWLLIFVIGIYGPLKAQDLSLTEEHAKTEDGQEVEAWVAHLDQPESSVRETFAQFIKQEYGLRTEKAAKNILVVPKAKLVEITSLRGDLRAIFTPRGNNTLVAIAFSPGYDIHLNEKDYPDELAKLGKVTRKYIKYHYTAFYKESLATTEKKISDRQDNMSKNTKRIARLKEDIIDNEAKISAGDKQSAKLLERNRKANESIASMETENTNWQAEITKLQENIVEANASLRKVMEF